MWDPGSGTNQRIAAQDSPWAVDKATLQKADEDGCAQPLVDDCRGLH